MLQVDGEPVKQGLEARVAEAAVCLDGRLCAGHDGGVLNLLGTREVAMQLCGWKSRAMLDRYFIVNETDLAVAVGRRFVAINDQHSGYRSS